MAVYGFFHLTALFRLFRYFLFAVFYLLFCVWNTLVKGLYFGFNHFSSFYKTAPQIFNTVYLCTICRNQILLFDNIALQTVDFFWKSIFLLCNFVLFLFHRIERSKHFFGIFILFFNLCLLLFYTVFTFNIFIFYALNFVINSFKHKLIILYVVFK